MNRNGKPGRFDMVPLIYQMLETERGGIQVYQTAIRCAQNDDLKEEWEKYLEQTQNHERILLRRLRRRSASTPSKETPGRKVVRTHRRVPGEGHGDGPDRARRRRRSSWRRMRGAAPRPRTTSTGSSSASAPRSSTGRRSKALKEAHEEVEDQEDEHLYHTTGLGAASSGFSRSGMPAVLPPPEEEKDVKTAIGAARAKQAREGDALGPAHGTPNGPGIGMAPRQQFAHRGRLVELPERSRAAPEPGQ